MAINELAALFVVVSVVIPIMAGGVSPNAVRAVSITAIGPSAIAIALASAVSLALGHGH
jgi:hypothetical protein